jgi:hypothetical protein
MARTRTNDQSPSLEQLRQWLPKGTRVFTILRSVSRSGMRREISVVVFLPGDDRPIHPNHHISQVLGLRRGKSDGVVLNGCGMGTWDFIWFTNWRMRSTVTPMH